MFLSSDNNTYILKHPEIKDYIYVGFEVIRAMVMKSYTYGVISQKIDIRRLYAVLLWH
jgi:hypothetical protein